MNFTDPSLNSLLNAWATSTEHRERAEAHNIMFEERLGQDRMRAFEDAAKGGCADLAGLKHELIEFVMKYIQVDAPRIPPTFRAENSGASMRTMSPEQKLVRLEDITSVLVNADRTLDALVKSHASTEPAVWAVLDVFLDGWNDARDSRPAFAAFKDQLLPEIGDAAWAQKLRDRLGLADFSARRRPMIVALMEYTVEEVLDEAARSPDIAHPFCVPTFLDSKPSSQFFPTPKEAPAGAPMALFEVQSDDQLIA